jgi:hypothetical protein
MSASIIIFLNHPELQYNSDYSLRWRETGEFTPYYRPTEWIYPTNQNYITDEENDYDYGE